jgi:type I restriction enzyme S subunit
MTTTKNNIPIGYKDSAVGIIPQDWEVKRVKDIGKVVTGSTPPTTDASNYGNEYMFVSPADLSDRQKYIYCTKRMLSSKGYNKSRKIPKGAVLYTCIGSTIGKIGIAPCELSSNQQINAVICKNDNEYLYYVLLYRTGQIRMLAGEQAVPIINKSDFENIFEAAGVNQTQHSVMLNLDTTVILSVSGKRITYNVKTSFCVAQTVIVGSVPNVTLNK